MSSASKVRRAEVRPSEPIKLLEVNENTVPSGIMPLGFGPAPAAGINFSYVIIEVTPDEYRLIQSEELKLPHGWTVGNLIFRSTAMTDRSEANKTASWELPSEAETTN